MCVVMKMLFADWWWLVMDDKFKVKAEWYFEYENDPILGPFFNSFSPDGLAWIGDKIQGGPAPYLVIGDDTATGYTITEVFRKPVSAVTKTGNLVRYRTQLLPGEANGDHKKTSIFVEGTDVEGTGVMLNLLRQPWSKASNTVLTVECRITVQQGVS